MTFSSETFLPQAILNRLTDVRVQDPERALCAAHSRKQRQHLTHDGRLNLLAADHPARRVVAVGDAPLAMASRRDYLARIVRVVLGGAVDGVMATMDILEELLLLHDMVREAGGPAFLDDKLLIPSLNRGGLAGVCWEMDDPVTGATPQACADWHMDGAKLLLRLCDDEPRSLSTLKSCAEAIGALNRLSLPTFLEPLPVARSADGYRVLKETQALAEIVGVAAALGDSSRTLWLKLPYCKNYERVAGATTLPILLLGGPARGDARPLLDQVASGIAAGANVRGALVGRNVLYPGDGDPLEVATAVNGIVHHGLTVAQALAQAQAERGRDVDDLTRWLA